jgi:hypothetical protein
LAGVLYAERSIASSIGRRHVAHVFHAQPDVLRALGESYQGITKRRNSGRFFQLATHRRFVALRSQVDAFIGQFVFRHEKV